MSNEYTPVEAVVVSLTKKAVLLQVEGRQMWVPQSCIFEDDLAELGQGVCMEVNVATWFVNREMLA